MALNEVIIFGASGYSGLELLRLLSRNPHWQVVGASSSKWCREPVARRVPTWSTSLAFDEHDAVLELARPGRFALLATPADVSLRLAPQLIDRGVRVVDLSGAFRLKDPALYPKWYGFEHTRPDLLAEAHYGLVDVPQASEASEASKGFEVSEASRGSEADRSLEARRRERRLVANPGCYATAAILAAAPLVARGLIRDEATLIVDGKSGATGAGRKADEALLYAEVSENLRPYRLLRHQHTPEIEQALSLVAGRPISVVFTAHLVPMRRGILASLYAPSSALANQGACDSAFREFYATSPLVRYLGTVPPETGTVSWTNVSDLASSYDARTGMLSAYSAIDNLVKGAAGQAIENLNLLAGLAKETGLG